MELDSGAPQGAISQDLPLAAVPPAHRRGRADELLPRWGMACVQDRTDTHQRDATDQDPGSPGDRDGDDLAHATAAHQRPHSDRDTHNAKRRDPAAGPGVGLRHEQRQTDQDQNHAQCRHCWPPPGSRSPS